MEIAVLTSYNIRARSHDVLRPEGRHRKHWNPSVPVALKQLTNWHFWTMTKKLIRTEKNKWRLFNGITNHIKHWEKWKMDKRRDPPWQQEKIPQKTIIWFEKSNSSSVALKTELSVRCMSKIPTQKAEAGRLWILAQPGPYSMDLSQKKKIKLY